MTSPKRGSPKALAAWTQLNDRQQGTLAVVYELDKQAEASRRQAAARGNYDRTPAAIWRAIDFSHDPAFRDVLGLTQMQRRLDERGWDNQGNGSTIAALASRGLLTRGQHPTDLGVMRTVTLTTAGRAAARAGLSTLPATAPKPTLSPRSWEVLALLWAVDQRGQILTWTYSKTIEFSLIERHDPPLAARRSGGYAITDHGRDFYCEHYATHTTAYPTVRAPHPHGAAAEPWPQRADELLAQHERLYRALCAAWKDAHQDHECAQAQADAPVPQVPEILPAAVAAQIKERHQTWCDTARQRADLAQAHTRDLQVRAEHAARAWASAALAAFGAAAVGTDPLEVIQEPGEPDDWDEQPLVPPVQTGIHAVDTEATKRHAAAMGVPLRRRGPAPKPRVRSLAGADKPELPGAALAHLAAYLHEQVTGGALTRRLHPTDLHSGPPTHEPGP